MNFHGSRLDCVQIVAGLSIEAGGITYCVPALSNALAEAGNQVEIATIDSQSWAPQTTDQFQVHRAPPSSNGLMRQLAWSGALLKDIEAAAKAGKILHTNGLWLVPNIYPSMMRKKYRSAGVKLVHSPHGMLGLEALKISAAKKFPIWHLFQRHALEQADCIHATAESEYDEVRLAGLTNPVAIIPNGIDLPPLDEIPDRTGRVNKQILSLGRIHPKKGLDRLIQAWAQLEPSLPDWSLRIVGNAELNHDVELKALAGRLGVQRLDIDGPCYGQAKWQAYADADLFVLPTRNENFAITVAEALGSKLPVISTTGAPWSGLVTQKCGWWVDQGIDPMVAALLEATSATAEERDLMGARGRAWMEKDFSWKRIGVEMAAMYQWLQRGGTPPESVRFA